MSKSLNVVTSAFGKASDGLKVNYDAGPTNEYINYLNNYNTKNADSVYDNLSSWAARASQNLNDMGGYVFNVDASDEALSQMQQTSFDNAVRSILPSYEAQKDALHTRLLNQGLGVDSEAYRRAMSSLEASQNAAINDAAYKALEEGQNALTTRLNNQIAAAQFSNSAQQDYINQLISALEGTLSGYDVANEKYTAGNNLAEAKSKAQAQSLENKIKLITKAMDSAAKVASGYAKASAGGAA